MTLVGVHDLHKSFGGRAILRGANLVIGPEARIGLVGQNGTGKSTLLEILAGREDGDAGEVTRRRDLRIAYLPQQIPGDSRTPLQFTMAARPEVAAVEDELVACETSLAAAGSASDLRRIERMLERQEQLLRRFEEIGGPGFEGEARSYLRGLGLDVAAIEQPMTELSGGQRKLVALAACLAQRPELLLLDEPETHLDLPHRQYLEALIRAFAGAVVIVSHDRYLLDETVSEIAELDRGVITLWPGNYSAYTLARELALQRQQTVFTAQQKEIARLEAAIARFKLWASLVPDERHIKQARNKQRQIDRMEKVERPVLERRKMALELRSAARGGQKVLELRDVDMAFGEDIILMGANLLITRGERVGIIGPNGAGKSVLAKLLVGELEPTGGQRWIGPSISLGYFAQGHDTLDPDATPVEMIRAAKPYYEEQAVALLGRYLFSYDQARQPIATLSGGERSRLQLLLLMLSGDNCLILDEPTNHLDIASAEVLEGALERYDGTVAVISHDRYFLDRIVDRIVEVRDGDLVGFDGGYSLWREGQQAQARAG